MGVWKIVPSSWLEAINDAGAYYYACYLTINITGYIPVSVLCGFVAQRSPRVLQFARRVAQNRLEAANVAVWRPKARQKRWTGLMKKANDENNIFWFGFSLGLLVNETILMPPELVLAAPLTGPFKSFCHRFPTVDDKLISISNYCLESVQKELDKREAKRRRKLGLDNP